MSDKSRTAKSLKNARIALLYYCINLILQFFSRKVFIDYLGAELLGLNATATNLLQFLNLAELGINSAIGYALYSPLATEDRKAVCDIISIQGFLYRRIAWIIIGGALILMFFFPFFFQKTELPLGYAYATFGVLLINALAGYFFNYRQIILTADQKEYKLNNAIQRIRLVKTLLQILCIATMAYGYIWWLALELIGTVGTVWSINSTVRKEYPWLKTNLIQGKLLRHEYPHIATKTKQLFFRKISGYVFSQTSPLIIYAYASLTLVAIYSNYMLIITGIVVLLKAVFNGIDASIGNLIVENDKNKILQVFRELFSSRFLIATLICTNVVLFINPFITLWIGKDYLLDPLALYLLVGILYIQSMRTVVDLYLNAYGLFHDIWATITEAVLNIGLSILLGYYWGLHGILSGVLISLIVIVFLWRPYFLFTQGLHEKLSTYIDIYSRHILAAGIIITGLFILSRWWSIGSVTSWTKLILHASIVTIITGICLTGLLYRIEPGMRNFIHRIYSFILHK